VTTREASNKLRESKHKETALPPNTNTHYVCRHKQNHALLVTFQKRIAKLEIVVILQWNFDGKSAVCAASVGKLSVNFPGRALQCEKTEEDGYQVASTVKLLMLHSLHTEKAPISSDNPVISVPQNNTAETADVTHALERSNVLQTIQ